MASKQTSNYGLTQWEREDKVLMEDFNADNAKIDAAIQALKLRVDGKADTTALNSLKTTVNAKASTTALNSLKTTVNTKASQTDLDALAQKVETNTTTLSGKGNCQIYTTSYKGTGTTGESGAVSITFPAVPALVFIYTASEYMLLFPTTTTASAMFTNGPYPLVSVSWSGKTVKWYGNNVTAQMNITNQTYHVLALLPA